MNDDGTRRGFYNHLTVGEWDKKVYEEKGGVEKNWVRMLREQGRSWSLAKTAEEAWEVANGFYEKVRDLRRGSNERSETRGH